MAEFWRIAIIYQQLVAMLRGYQETLLLSVKESEAFLKNFVNFFIPFNKGKSFKQYWKSLEQFEYQEKYLELRKLRRSQSS